MGLEYGAEEIFKSEQSSILAATVIGPCFVAFSKMQWLTRLDDMLPTQASESFRLGPLRIRKQPGHERRISVIGGIVTVWNSAVGPFRQMRGLSCRKLYHICI